MGGEICETSELGKGDWGRDLDDETEEDFDIIVQILRDMCTQGDIQPQCTVWGVLMEVEERKRRFWVRRFGCWREFPDLQRINLTSVICLVLDHHHWAPSISFIYS